MSARDEIVAWMNADTALLGDSETDARRPRLDEAFAVYGGSYAPLRPSSAIVGPLADFVELLRQGGRASRYSDEEWIRFLVRFTDGDEDKARDLWDALVCQPE